MSAFVDPRGWAAVVLSLGMSDRCSGNNDACVQERTMDASNAVSSIALPPTIGASLVR